MREFKATANSAEFTRSQHAILKREILLSACENVLWLVCRIPLLSPPPVRFLATPILVDI